MDKNNLRKKAKKIRNGLDILKISEYFVNILQDNEIYIQSQNIMLYYPLKSEINLCQLLKYSPNKNFYLPKICGENLSVCPWCSEDKLCLSKFKTFEPCTEEISPKELDLVIVPALMVDINNYRLGYGGGFYDRFLAEFEQYFKTMTLIPKELLVQNLPVEEFDKKIDIVLST